jgi:hypothetical protein
MSDDTTKREVNAAPGRCPGTGARALLDMASGFFGCPLCKVAQGVILRAGDYLTPEHNFGEMYRERTDTTFTLRPGHEGHSVLALAASQGLPKDMVIDLLAYGVARLRAELAHAQAAATKLEEPKIVLPGWGNN